MIRLAPKRYISVPLLYLTQTWQIKIVVKAEGHRETGHRDPKVVVDVTVIRESPPTVSSEALE
jgi:hypothetical protein